MSASVDGFSQLFRSPLVSFTLATIYDWNSCFFSWPLFLIKHNFRSVSFRGLDFWHGMAWLNFWDHLSHAPLFHRTVYLWRVGSFVASALYLYTVSDNNVPQQVFCCFKQADTHTHTGCHLLIFITCVHISQSQCTVIVPHGVFRKTRACSPASRGTARARMEKHRHNWLSPWCSVSSTVAIVHLC